MANVYVINDNSNPEPMTRIRCMNEDLELQLILEKNPDLLPGDQINPNDPRRWLLIKREMPVPDPGTGNNRWSVDFLFADQDAIPTFVECKRFEDTRSRREVVGQMFEYAANGHYYWTKDMLCDYAENSAKQKGLSLDDAIRTLLPTDCEDAGSYFDKVQDNLREGQVRIIFFLEESPMELRSVVDFLNKQMERSEILLVEARQYSLNGLKIVVPTLFGYTEEARQVKRSITITTANSRKKWDKASFFADAQQKLSLESLHAIRLFYDRCVELGFEVVWGTGKENGSFSITESSVIKKTTMLSVFSNGTLWINFGSFKGSPLIEKARDRFKELIIKNADLKIPDDYQIRFPQYPQTDWISKAERIAEALNILLTEFRETST